MHCVASGTSSPQQPCTEMAAAGHVDSPHLRSSSEPPLLGSAPSAAPTRAQVAGHRAPSRPKWHSRHAVSRPLSAIQEGLGLPKTGPQSFYWDPGGEAQTNASAHAPS
ncbi:hypothetical protein NDU88_004358 [Pleurodeles waltl]|uniref:Uncharacterized protein n=1 Tax=Pleurodeles waltl TaxID=8319 RepID=A0AAV7WY07_PLEWA|nr:hypothetical protein NDU88_004358 [Pleurodeles waltl]